MACDYSVPEMNGVEQRHMISKRCRDKSSKRKCRLIGSFLTIGLITGLIDWKLIFNHRAMYVAIAVDKLQLADINKYTERGNSGNDVFTVDDSVNLNA